MTVFSALINKTVLCLVLRVFSKVLWQNWFLEVFETHFHCVGRLNTLSFPQLIVGGGQAGGGGGAKMEQPLPAYLRLRTQVNSPGLALTLLGETSLEFCLVWVLG